MAELRAAEAAVAALEADLAALRRCSDESGREDVAAVEQLRQLLARVAAAVEGEALETMDKFRERTKMVDPISNEPRFGPKTMARVLDMLSRYDAARVEATDGELVPKLRRVIEEFEARQAGQARAAEELRREQERERENERLREEEQRRVQEEERERQRQHEREVEEKRVAELARLAQLKREERERQRLEEEAKAQAELERLRQQNESVEVGVHGLSQAVERLQSGFGSDVAAARKTLHKLLELISNVCSSPENSAFRHIPKDNVHFHNDIGQFDGGYDCILAMGFKELETEPGKRVFIMEEPDLSEDFDKWSGWFDSLKEMKEMLEKQLNSSK